MRRSFVRLLLSSLVLVGILGFVVMVLFVRSLVWDRPGARRDGVFLAYRLLQAEPAEQRAQRLRELQSDVGAPLALRGGPEVIALLGRELRPLEQVQHQARVGEHWWLLAFGDGEPVLVAGPVNPASPPGGLPIGLLIAVVGLPLLGAGLAFRLERGVSQVERASEALAAGALETRVVGPEGPAQELAESFNAMAERVERLVRDRDELVQAVSHELGSPLSRLRFHLELLDDPMDEARQPQVRAMTRELDALDELVAEFLSYVQSDNRALERQRFDPGPMVGDLAELARLELPDDSAITTSLEMAGEVEVAADPRAFQRAIENLLRNAVRYAREVVCIEVTQEEVAVRVSVHDDGPGIPVELRERVLQPFMRVESDRGRAAGGVGLGLAIVSRIVARHGGRIEIGESPRGGAVITTWWPHG